MPEIVKRLAPKPETLRELFLKSGNLCAFPGCGALMMDADGVFIGQLCHIEAAEEGGERFNPAMSNEDRRQAANLMLMCYPHHQVTNDVAKYPVARLRTLKADHEGRFADPARAILERLTDWTAVSEPALVTNLRRMDDVLGWGHGPVELAESVTELNDFIGRLRNVPIDLRRFAGAVARRAARMKGHRVTQDSMFGINVLISDLAGAYNLSASKVGKLANELDGYGVGCVDEIDTDLGLKPAVRLHHLRSGWKIWPDLLDFCERAPEPLEAFIEQLDFARLDAPEVVEQGAGSGPTP